MENGPNNAAESPPLSSETVAERYSSAFDANKANPTLTRSLEPTVNHVCKAVCIGVRHIFFAVAGSVELAKVDDLKYMVLVHLVLRPTGKTNR